ncbi:MAG: hypothetical protein ACXAAH_08435 [Promethearchaeota archaeon]|jgi:hypothetical protein
MGIMQNIWSDPIGWFLDFPLGVQILIIVGLIALTIAALVLVYYILKGVAYLLYYLFKGLYLLLKAIFTGIYKLFEELFYSISGKPRKKIQEVTPPSGEPINLPEYTSEFQEESNIKIPYYCTECGQKITESMNSLLTSQGVAFCFYCGTEFKLKKNRLL